MAYTSHPGGGVEGTRPPLFKRHGVSFSFSARGCMGRVACMGPSRGPTHPCTIQPNLDCAWRPTRSSIAGGGPCVQTLLKAHPLP